MIDADTYWAAYDLYTARNGAFLPNPKPASFLAAELLPGGCLLYRLSTPNGRGTDKRAPDATPPI
jgi:hypothetical protein